MGTLIICEKNDAAKQIAKILSDGNAKRRTGGGSQTYEWKEGAEEFVVMGLRGHIVELDFDKEHRRWSIQAEKLHGLVDADPTRVVSEDKIGKTLKQKAARADKIIVATDYDREGELIGVEALHVLGKKLDGKDVKRAKYSSFTKSDVKGAFAVLQEVDYKLAKAGEARQVIDLAWGAALTRFVSVAGGRRGRNFLSVGRVQTPTLGLIVQREKKIRAFEADPYWEVRVELEGDEEVPRWEARHVRNGFKGSKDEEGFTVFAGYDGHFGSPEEAEAARSAIAAAGSAVLTAADEREKADRAPTPFSTTAFQRAASGLGFGVKRAMDIAQKLYLGGLISYHRTENTVYPESLDLNELVQILQSGPLSAEASWVAGNRRPTPTRGRKETTDHPPIYPTGVPGTEHKLKAPELRIWELVARRFLATLSPDARVKAVSAQLEAGGEKLRASGQTTVDPGWRYVMGPFFKGKETPLPRLDVGASFKVIEAVRDDKETQPPKRYGQGGLIAKMEELGIGTKATRHETIQKLIDRHYIAENPVAPTGVGFAVTDALEEHASVITQPAMTAKLEQEMSDIADGKRTLDETISDSRTLLHEAVEVLITHKEPISNEVRAALEEDAKAGPCPKCGNTLLVRHNRFGGRFIGCKGWKPDNEGCDAAFNLPPRGRLTFEEAPCPSCQAPVVEVDERGRKSVQCVNQDCETRQEALKAEMQDLGPCPTCRDGMLQSSRSRNWKRYVVCTNDDCTQTYPLPQRGDIEPQPDACTFCAAPHVSVVQGKRKPWLICINMECEFNQRKSKKAEEDQPAAETTT